MNESVDERKARLGRNESVFRAVNDQIERLNETFSSVADVVIGIICECGDMSCAEQFQIQGAEYARVRADDTLFLLVNGHEDLTVEVVVESDNPAYVVVRKPLDTPAEIAANAVHPAEQVRLDAIDAIAEYMLANDMSSAGDFEAVRDSMLPDRPEDFLASRLLSISWYDVKKRLDEIS